MTTNNQNLKINTSENEKNSQSFLREYYKAIVVFFIIIALLTGMLLLNFQNKALVKAHGEEIHHISILQNEKIDSLSENFNSETVRVFSWAVRGELSRNNLEGVEQLVVNFVQMDQIEKVLVVDSKSSKTLISTDKKDEGKKYKEIDLTQISTLETFKDSTTLTVINPIMGLDKRIGVLIVKVSRK